MDFIMLVLGLAIVVGIGMNLAPWIIAAIILITVSFFEWLADGVRIALNWFRSWGIKK